MKKSKGNGLSEREKMIFQFAFNVGSHFGCQYYKCDIVEDYEKHCAETVDEKCAKAERGGKV